MDNDARRLIELHADRAYAIALRMSGNPADAGDLVQEAFLRAMKYAHSYDPSQPFEGWLHRIIRNIYVDSLRREARRRQVPLSGDSRDEDAGSLEDVLSDPDRGPESQAMASDAGDAVQRALATLNPAYRMAVVLVDLEGVEREQAAAIVGCSVGALDVRLHRARAQLREKLEKYRKGEA